jgi:hypothetical protein
VWAAQRVGCGCGKEVSDRVTWRRGRNVDGELRVGVWGLDMLK